MIPGEYFISDRPVAANAGRKTVRVRVSNTGNRPVQVGSHTHFFEVNKALEFPREKAYGFHLNIPAGTQPEQVFRLVYSRHAGPLFRFLIRFTANSETAEEILHDVFVEFLGGKFRPEPGASLKNWLYTLAKNKSLNHLRKKSFDVIRLSLTPGLKR